MADIGGKIQDNHPSGSALVWRIFLHIEAYFDLIQPPPRPKKLLDQVREAIRVKHYS